MHPDIHTYLTAITAGQGDGYLEVRYRTPRGMRQRFFAARAITPTARFIARVARRSDVYVGVAPRTRRAGAKTAITHSHLAWAEVDQPDAAQRLAALACPPSMIIRSGGHPGHLHAYWRLATPLAAAEVEQLNARLALALGADTRCIDVTRILRPPQSQNWKRTPPGPVSLVCDLPRRYDANELAATLPTLLIPRRPSSPPRPVGAVLGEWQAIDEQLRAIPAAEYVTALTGRAPDRTGKITCPFHHPDDTPSLHVYEHDWYCFACAVGGSLYDLGSRVFGLDTRGPDFRALRARLARELLPAASQPTSRQRPGARGRAHPQAKHSRAVQRPGVPTHDHQEQR